MSIQKSRWSRVYESSEEELQAFLQSRGLTAERLTLAEFDEADQPDSGQPITLWCAEGSMTLQSASGKLSLQPGDTARIPAATSYRLLAGISGCVYYAAR